MNPFGGRPGPKIRVRDLEKLVSEGYTHLHLHPATNGWSAHKSEDDARTYGNAIKAESGYAPWADQYVIYSLHDCLVYKPAFVAK